MRDAGSDVQKTVLAAPDKFRGTASAPEIAAAIAEGAARAGQSAVTMPLADGGEGTVDAFGGANRRSEVTGPLGGVVTAPWRLDGDFAVIEMAAASGLSLAGGREHNDPFAATTRGTGELILAAIAAGVRDIVVGVGGSATTDGGEGALEALGYRPFSELGVRVEVACDVVIPFTDAAVRFGPQKGADEPAVRALTGRLEALAERYRERFGVDVLTLDYAGAAGGLAGGLYALGAELRSGFTLVAEHVGLESAIVGASLVVTGEGRLDATSAVGKVVGSVAKLAAYHGVPVLVVAGEVAPDAPPELEVRSLTAQYGMERARRDTLALVSEVVAAYLHGPSGRDDPRER